MLVLCAAALSACPAAYAQQQHSAGAYASDRLQEEGESPSANRLYMSLSVLHPVHLLNAGLGEILFGAAAMNPRAAGFGDFFEGGPKASGLALAGGFGAGPPARRRHDFWFREAPARNVVFAGFDATERERFFSAGFKRAIRGDLDTPGFRLMATLGIKIREYDPAQGLSQSRLQAARLVFGHEWKVAALSVTVMAGGSFVLNTADATQQTRRLGRTGPVGMVEFWQDWGSRGALGSRFTTLFAMLDQASRSSYFRLRHGFAYSDRPLRFGPEASFATGESQFRRGVRLQGSWRKARLGAHVSEIPLRQAQLSLSAGLEWRADRNPGGYIHLGAYLRY